MKKFSLNAIQKALIEFKINGWLFYDFMGSDPISRTILRIEPDTITTNRWFYYIPAQGAPQKLVHSLENKIFDHLPGKKEIYIGWKEMGIKLRSFLKDKKKIAVQYSPQNAIPMISKIDAGMHELLKSFNLNLISSGDLVQLFEACLSKMQLNTHLNVGGELDQIVHKTFRYIKRKVQTHQEITEWGVHVFLSHHLQARGLISNIPQVVAVSENTGDPRYLTREESSKPIHTGTLIQLALRSREKDEDAVYASTSRIAFVGEKIPDEYVEKFSLLKKAQDEALVLIDTSMKNGKRICGWEVDQLARNILEHEGLGGNYLHRTGHSLGTSFYGHGVNLDNLETRDERHIISDLCFTISPGLYFSEYGMRTEINVHVDKKGAHLSTPSPQDKIYHIIPRFK
jgi:Xaa-Pro aminopeptidase